MPRLSIAVLRPLAFAALFCAGAGAVAADTALLPGDAANGKKLLAVHCMECHDTGVYTRKDRRIKSLGGLIGQVEACNRLLKKELTPAQVNDLIAYLNETYYRFE